MGRPHSKKPGSLNNKYRVKTLYKMGPKYFWGWVLGGPLRYIGVSSGIQRSQNQFYDDKFNIKNKIFKIATMMMSIVGN